MVEIKVSLDVLHAYANLIPFYALPLSCSRQVPNINVECYFCHTIFLHTTTILKNKKIYFTKEPTAVNLNSTVISVLLVTAGKEVFGESGCKSSPLVRATRYETL